MTFPKAMQDKWDQAAANPGVKIPVGDMVVCDSCDKDYTHSPATGGMIFDSKAICPACEPKWRKSAEKFEELDHIRAVAAEGQRFQDFVVAYRGPNVFIRVTGGKP